ncbi:MAG TPA: hypothetical protein ENH09_00405, partial [Bacteroidetes bacterium]|nr:hypothetical protein [Bacteroidota bacterium]
MLKLVKKVLFSFLFLLLFISCSRGGDYTKKIILQTPWGSAPGNFGLLKEAEGVAPEALAIDADENIWVIDLVNSRLQAFGKEGGFIRTFPISIRAMDIAVGPEGKLYLMAPYDDRLTVMDTTGKLIKSFAIPSDINLIEGIRWEANRLVMTTAEQKSYTLLKKSQVGRLSQSPFLMKPSVQPLEGLAGRFGDRRFQTVWKSKNAGEIWILNADGQTKKEIRVVSNAQLGSVRYLNTDAEKNFYILEEILPAPQQSEFKVLRYS